MNIRPVVIALVLLFATHIRAESHEEWLTVLIHGIVGLQANFSIATLIQAKRDMTEGTPYEKNVLELREHPYLTMIQPIGKLGLHEVVCKKDCLSAAYAFGQLFSYMERLCGINRNNRFYTFGWPGIVSQKKRLSEARVFYCGLKKELARLAEEGVHPKVRVIGFSHGATVALNIGDIYSQENPQDQFFIDELYLLGMPVTRAR